MGGGVSSGESRLGVLHLDGRFLGGAHRRIFRLVDPYRLHKRLVIRLSLHDRKKKNVGAGRHAEQPRA